MSNEEKKIGKVVLPPWLKDQKAVQSFSKPLLGTRKKRNKKNKRNKRKWKYNQK